MLKLYYEHCFRLGITHAKVVRMTVLTSGACGIILPNVSNLAYVSIT